MAIAAVLTVVITGSILPLAHAQTDEGFSLQVSPSPLVATVQPGSSTTLELRIRNTNSSNQALKMGLRSFTIDPESGQVNLGEAVSAEIAQMVSFGASTFTLEAGQIYTQKVIIRADKNKGFSYNFAITISQANPPKEVKGQSAITGSVAVFTLITVNKPGAVKRVELASLAASRHSYEYLPAEISLELKNTGNVNVQPTGTVFIQRKSTDSKPLAILPLNDAGGYVLPGATRTFTVTWNDGFPHYEANSSGSALTRELSWQGGGLSELRFGKYVAKVVAVYDDGERDIPIMAEVSFWVIPWRFIAVALIVLAVVLVGVFVTVRSIGRAARRASHKIHHPAKKHSDDA